MTAQNCGVDALARVVLHSIHSVTDDIDQCQEHISPLVKIMNADHVTHANLRSNVSTIKFYIKALKSTYPTECSLELQVAIKLFQLRKSKLNC